MCIKLFFFSNYSIKFPISRNKFILNIKTYNPTILQRKNEHHPLRTSAHILFLYLTNLNEKGEKVIFTGDGVSKHKEFLTKNVNNCEFAPNHLSIIRASSLGELGMEKIKIGEVDDMNSAPLYIKKPQAERELEQRLAMKNENRL